MARPNRSEVISPDESCIVHVMSRVVRRYFLLGDDPLTGKNYDHRKEWIEKQIEHQAKHFGIDLLCFSLLATHFHLILKSQPEIVGTWTSREVARRWLMLCPKRKQRDGSPAEPKETEINSIVNDAVKLKQIRSRPSPSGYRCSDNGFLNMSVEDYLALLDWTARQPVAGKRGMTPADAPAILERLGLEPDVWCELVRDFGTLFSLVAGRPAAIDQARTRGRQARFHTRPRTRELLSV